MKNLTVLFSLLFALSSCNGNAQNRLKRYEVKSGIIEYVTTTTGKVMGSSVSGSGTEKLFFKDWGSQELKETESSQTTTMRFFGKEKTDTKNTHSLNKLDNGESYSVDFDKKKIYAGRDMTMDMTKEFQPDANAGAVGESMLESMGGEKIGKETFLGYTCDVWNLLGGKQWIFKGVMLKMEIFVLGIKTVTEATSIKFDVSVSDTNFKLPNFPIQKDEGFSNNEEYNDDMKDMDVNMEKISKMSFEEWKKLAAEGDEDIQNMSEAELHETYNTIQNMIKARLGK